MSVRPVFRPVFRGVVARAFLLPNGQDGAAVRLEDGRLISAWAQERHAPGQGVEVCHVGAAEWGVLGPIDAAPSDQSHPLSTLEDQP